MPSAKTKLEPFQPGWLPATLECSCQIPPKHGACNGRASLEGKKHFENNETGPKESSLHLRVIHILQKSKVIVFTFATQLRKTSTVKKYCYRKQKCCLNVAYI